MSKRILQETTIFFINHCGHRIIQNFERFGVECNHQGVSAFLNVIPTGAGPLQPAHQALCALPCGVGSHRHRPDGHSSRWLCLCCSIYCTAHVRLQPGGAQHHSFCHCRSCWQHRCVFLAGSADSRYPRWYAVLCCAGRAVPADQEVAPAVQAKVLLRGEAPAHVCDMHNVLLA